MKFLILKVWWLTLFVILTGWGDTQIVGKTLLKYFCKCLWGCFWKISIWLTRLKRSALTYTSLRNPTTGNLNTIERKRKGEFSLFFNWDVHFLCLQSLKFLVLRHLASNYQLYQWLPWFPGLWTWIILRAFLCLQFAGRLWNTWTR